jgi:hypothetical protein
MSGLGKMFGGGMPKQAAVRMPDTDKTDEIEAQRRKLRSAAKTGGRESTNLTGGGSYMNETLGS